MAFSAAINESITTGGETIGLANTFSADAVQNVDETIAADQTDTEIAFVLAVEGDETVWFYASCDQDIIIETNNGGTPIDTITLVAGQPYIWHEDSLATFLLTTDVTALFVTTGSISASANLKIRAGYDPTP